MHPESLFPPQNSPDIPVTGEADVTQSENSIFISPDDEDVILNSNNSSTWISGFAQDPLGADALYSTDGGQVWGGSTNGTNGTNAGDPSTAIGPNGWWYVGRINGNFGQAVSYSKDQGQTWNKVNVGAGPFVGIGLLDKNHLWIDNAESSPSQRHALGVEQPDAGAGRHESDRIRPFRQPWIKLDFSAQHQQCCSGNETESWGQHSYRSGWRGICRMEHL